MSTAETQPKICRKVVVVFDICSSTAVLEDLLKNGRLRRWRSFLIRLKNYLVRNAEIDGYEVYKFLGDGYILLYDPEQRAIQTFDSLWSISRWFDENFHEDVGRHLQHRLPVTGITFGVDEGELIQITMQGREEYVGRAINVASRLQGVAARDSNPNGLVLISRPYYSEVSDGLEAVFDVYDATESLRNVSGGDETECNELDLHTRKDEDDCIPEG